MNIDINIPKPMMREIKSQMEETHCHCIRTNEWIRDAIREKLEKDELFYRKLRHHTL